MRLILRLVRQDLRGGLKSLYLMVLLLALGSAAIAGAGLLGNSLLRAININAQAILGGEIAIVQSHRSLPPAIEAELAAVARVSKIIEMRGMLLHPNGNSSLVEIKAVDQFYPLLGDLKLSAERENQAAFDPNLLFRLNAARGDKVRLGQKELHLKAEIISEPDRASNAIVLGPRLLIDLETLEASGLLRSGSLYRQLYRLQFKEGIDPEQWLQDFKSRHPNPSFRILTLNDAAPALKRQINNILGLIALLGLVILSLGSLGAMSSVQAHLQSRMQSIGILKSLGASGRIIFLTFLAEIVFLASLGVMGGMALGSLFIPLGNQLLAETLPFKAALFLDPQIIARTWLITLGLTLGFALFPLGQAIQTPASAIFRQGMQNLQTWPSLRITLAALTLLGATFYLIVATSPQRGLAQAFCGGIGLSLLLLWGMLKKLRALPLLPWPYPLWRLAWRRLRSDYANKGGILVPTGLGFTLLCSLWQVEFDLKREIATRLPQSTPSFFFIDVQPDQEKGLTEIAQEFQGREMKLAPTVRGRLSHIKGIPAENYPVPPEVEWAIHNDRSLTYSGPPPAGTQIVKGQWWPPDYKGPALVSLESKLARGLGVDIGDKLVFNIMGIAVEARIASLRELEWQSLNLNFAFIFSPGSLEGAPYSLVGTLALKEAQESPFERKLAQSFPNIASVRIKAALAQVEGLVRQAGEAALYAGLATLLTGILAIIAGLGAILQEREREVSIMRALGLKRKAIFVLNGLEMLFLGLIAGLLGVLAGEVIGFIVTEKLLHLQWQMDFRLFWLAPLGAGSTVLAAVALRLWGMTGRTSPAQALRE